MLSVVFAIALISHLPVIHGQFLENVYYSTAKGANSCARPTSISRSSASSCTRSDDTYCYTSTFGAYTSNNNCTEFLDSKYYNLESAKLYLIEKRFGDNVCAGTGTSSRLYLADGECHSSSGSFFFKVVPNSDGSMMSFYDTCDSTCSSCSTSYLNVTLPANCYAAAKYELNTGAYFMSTGTERNSQKYKTTSDVIGEVVKLFGMGLTAFIGIIVGVVVVIIVLISLCVYCLCCRNKNRQPNPIYVQAQPSMQQQPLKSDTNMYPNPQTMRSSQNV